MGEQPSKVFIQHNDGTAPSMFSTLPPRGDYLPLKRLSSWHLAAYTARFRLSSASKTKGLTPWPHHPSTLRSSSLLPYAVDSFLSNLTLPQLRSVPDVPLRHAFVPRPQASSGNLHPGPKTHDNKISQRSIPRKQINLKYSSNLVFCTSH